MLDLRALSVATAVLLGAATHARASCAIELAGDVEVASWIRGELAAFADDPACLQVRVQCRRADDWLEIELRDELGRSAQRRFASPEGAAAYIVSWSRRPLPELRAALAPSTSTSTTRSLAPAWRPEIQLAATHVIDTKYPNWGAVTASLIKRSAIWRRGASLRVVAGAPHDVLYARDSYVGYVATEAEGTLGPAAELLDRLVVRGEVAVGGSLLSLVSRSGEPHYRAMGIRVGLRAAIAWQATSTLGLELGFADDILRQIDFRRESSPLGDRDYVHAIHLDLGIRWAP